jgi:hypothetical protein
MARTAVTPLALSRNSAVAKPAGTTIDATLVTNGVVIDISNTRNRLWIEVANTSGSTRVVTVQGGANYPSGPAYRGGDGSDLTLTLDATTGVGLFGPFESAVFVQDDAANAGKIFVDFATGTTGTIWAFYLAR